MNKILTIVVPSYNTQEHIDNCLPTIIDESYIDDIEILLINDGSTDDTQKILERYESKYPNSIRVINKKNGGHGSVINRGIQEATGKYFRVIDGDDPVVTGNLRILIEKLKKEESDLVYSSFYEEYVESGKRKLCFDHDLIEGKKYKFDEVYNRMGSLPLHAINYKTSILKDNNIRVQENCFYEDKEYMLYPIPFIEIVSYYRIPVYVYRIGVPGQSISVEKVIKNRKMLETITHNLCVFYEDVSKDISIEKREYLSDAICDVIKNMYGMFLKLPYGIKSKQLIRSFNKECKRWSPQLHQEMKSPVIKMLHSNSLILYTAAYCGFKIKRKQRGF